MNENADRIKRRLAAGKEHLDDTADMMEKIGDTPGAKTVRKAVEKIEEVIPDDNNM